MKYFGLRERRQPGVGGTELFDGVAERRRRAAPTTTKKSYGDNATLVAHKVLAFLPLGKVDFGSSSK